MRVLLQRVNAGKVTIDDHVVAKIGPGYVLLIGIGSQDGEEQAHYLAEKVINLRIFEDDQGKMNHSIQDIGGEALVVSQFTLYADTHKGRRPSFIDAAAPELANPLVEYFADQLRKQGVQTQQGTFGAHMQVEIVNDGPVTIMLER